MKTRMVLVSVLSLLTIVALILTACNPLDLFAEYRGINLISGYQFGQTTVTLQGWEPADSFIRTNHWNPGSYPNLDPPDAATTNVNNYYLNFTALSGADLTDAQSKPGYPSASTSVYRLEVKNQFTNGDFEAGVGTGINWVNQIAGTAGLAGTNHIGTGQAIEVNFPIGESVYCDLSGRINSWAEALAATAPASYIYHFDYYTQTGQTYYFQFDDGSDVPDYLYQIAIGARANQILHFPGDTSPEKNNYLEAGASYSRLYMGRVDQSVAFWSEIDNVRFVRADMDYSVRLQVPYVDQVSGLSLPTDAPYVFSVYVLMDYDTGSNPLGTNNFYTNTINIAMRDVYDAGLGLNSGAENFDFSGASGQWIKVELSVDGLVSGVPSLDTEPMIEIDITASALGLADGIIGESVYKLDAGSVLLANPALYLNVQ